MYHIEIDNLKESIDNAILEDVDTFGKTALIYNWHHTSNLLNTIDFAPDWDQEKERIKARKLTLTPFRKVINFGKAGDYDCIIWTAQPLGKNKIVDEKRYTRMTSHLLDPLGMAVGYAISGFCYLQIVIKV